jgi:anti-sigma regulatory factor (Ser/Thr protein kinase)
MEVWKDLDIALSARMPLEGEMRKTLDYAVSEMVNNAIDHSGGTSVVVSARLQNDGVVVTIADDGVGIFKRLEDAFGWSSPRDAIVQLEKGKTTTAPAAHSGEGLFFTSKVVTRFRLESGEVAWIVDNIVNDSGIGSSAIKKGTTIILDVQQSHLPGRDAVFARFTDLESGRFERSKTTIKLAAFGDTLMSRSEAKRVVAGLERFDEVELDFAGVDAVGQGFCDQIFRVFAKAHPSVLLVPVRANVNVAFMIKRAIAARV